MTTISSVLSSNESGARSTGSNGHVPFERIAITGGAGFIGTHLAQRLCEGTKLTLIDNFRRNSLEHMPALKAHANVNLKTCDVLNKEGVNEVINDAQAVVHLAAIAGVSSYYEQPLQTLKVNLLGTINVLDAAVAAGVKRFVYVSTSEVFGPDAMWVGDDDDHHVGGVSDKRWVYATSKLAGEQFVMRYGEAHGMKCTVIRPFNVYGPLQTGEGAIANFCSAAVKQQPITVYGDGTPLRAWCYVSDFVDAVCKILNNDNAAGQAFNIGNPREVETTLGLARLVARLAPGVEINFKDMTRSEVRSRIPKIEKARKILGWEPQIDLAEGISRTLEWHKGRGGK